MVVILSEVALLGKSFFYASEVTLAVRVGFRVDFREVREQPIGRDFFADRFPQEVWSERVTATAQGFADVFRQGNASLDEGVVEVGLGDFHNFIFFDFVFGCKDYFSTRAFIFSRTFLIA